MVIEKLKNKVVFKDHCQAQFFLTNDNRLRSITEIKVITISELA